MIDRPLLKQEAKERLQAAQVSPWLFTLLLMALLLVLNFVSSYTSGSYVRTLQQYMPGVELPAFLTHVPSLSPAAVTFIGILTSLVGDVLRSGNALYHLGIHRGSEMPYSTLLDIFSQAGRVIVLVILQTVFIALWSLLFVIPGIIAAYRYRFAMYNLLENPNMTAMEAIAVSKDQTSGYKMELFILDLSFLGWAFLCVLTCGVLSIWVSPYMTQTGVCYFQAIKAAKGIGTFTEGEPPRTDPFA